MSPLAVGHRLLFVTVAGARSDLLSAEGWWGQLSLIAIAPMTGGASLQGWRIHFTRDHEATCQ
jgi:hypothetical protein